jgi:hypothetical protein
MLRKERGRAADDGIVKIVAEIRDHTETGVIYQVGTAIVANSFENGGGHQGKGNSGPGIGEARRNELLKINGVMGVGNGEELNIPRSGGGIQHAIEHGPD